MMKKFILGAALLLGATVAANAKTEAKSYYNSNSIKQQWITVTFPCGRSQSYDVNSYTPQELGEEIIADEEFYCG